jgi:hypothetical protein
VCSHDLCLAFVPVVRYSLHLGFILLKPINPSINDCIAPYFERFPFTRLTSHLMTIDKVGRVTPKLPVKLDFSAMRHCDGPRLCTN